MSNISLTLIVDPDIIALQRYGLSITSEIISVGRGLSEFLIQEAQPDRTQSAIRWLETKLGEKAPGPVLCKDIDLLFEPMLGLDPLRLLQRISRFTKLIVLWPGSYKDGVLSYAVPEHKHYHHWKKPEGIEIKGVNDALQ